MRVKICFPSTSSNAYGSNRSALLLAKQLKRIGYDPVMVYPSDGKIVDQANYDSVLYHVIPMSKWLLDNKSLLYKNVFAYLLYIIYLMPYIIKISVYLKKTDFNIVHTNDLMSALIWGFAAKLNRIPVIWHVRQTKSSKILDKIRLILSDRIILVSKSLLKKFKEQDLKRIEYDIIYNSVNLEIFYPRETDSLKVELNLHKEAKIVGFVGALVQRKRPQMFVEAAIKILQHLNADHSMLHFIIVGEEAYNSGYKNSLKSMIIDSGKSSHFSLLGFRDDMADIMAEMDILIMTSALEGEAFPRVVIEAMASGTPVISTITSGVPEAIKDGVNGYLVDTDDIDSLIMKTINLLKKKDKLESMSYSAYKNVVKNYNSDKTTKLVVNIYEQLLSRTK